MKKEQEDDDDGISDYFMQESKRRFALRVMKLEEGEEGEDVIRRLDMGTAILRRLMRRNGISKLDFAKKLRVGEDFVTFLIGGYVLPDELTKTMRVGIAKMFDLDLEYVDLFFGPRGGGKE